ncbi:ABC transporter permease [Pseudoalteromonas sp. J010]|uniref:ABC transporter permease n=1 Tax=unclassified Pseudoalteromonas TaxID=194690 RepID=UPI000F645C38|nr:MULTISPECIES: ABC transporter permease [unclassified Pseudoalteromonas]RRS06776.1 ABC transporter permease [Pseudoalteromonas sp. J010]USD29536.1 ABC transporter permease [Pseudoalteromonas sp. SCSIO 43201]
MPELSQTKLNQTQPSQTKLYPFWQLMMVNIRPFFRDKAVLLWTFGLPIFIALLLIQAFSGGPKMSPINVVVMHGEQIEQKWLKAMEEDPLITVTRLSQTDSIVLEDSFASAQLAEVISSPGSVLRKLQNEISPEVYLAPNAMFSTHNSDESLMARNYLLRLKEQANGQVMQSNVVSVKGYRYTDWLIPGIIVLQVLGLALVSIANSLVSDRQNGFFKRLRLSPFKRRDYIIGIVLARLFLLVFQMAILFVAFHFLFGYTLQGNVVDIILVMALGSFCICMLGVLVGARSQRVEVSSGIANLLYFPLMFLSGIYFDTANFPTVLREIVSLLPTTAFLDALRLVANQGVELVAVSRQLIILGVTSVVFFLIVYFCFDWGDEKS